jgi:site-specific DNA-methyltransferase (adenine-specific)
MIADKWTSPDGTITLIHGDCMDILPTVGPVDAVITDPPYSARTHKGHDSAAVGSASQGGDGTNRKPLGYSFWTPADVAAFVAESHRACSGWMVCMTDYTLAPAWYESLRSHGRYAFAPLPYYAPGSRCRITGDGPSCWTDWIIAARTKHQMKWGTLPGGYLRTADYGSVMHMGGKPVGLMTALVNDYSRAGQLVCDPCMGGGTTGIACARTGRWFIGIEQNRESFELCVRRMEEELNRSPLFEKPADVQAMIVMDGAV